MTASNRTSGDDAAGWRDVLRSARPLSACGTAALEYAARGWEVFPAPPGEKKSHKSAKHSGGVKWGKTVDPKIIGEDFRKWPNANVAIVTGAASGIFVIEADTPKGHGVDGLASIKALEAEHGPFPETREAVSPSGSVHRYYRHPGADIYIKNSTSGIAPGVDIRGDGGMVIASPSIKPGVGEYRWLNDLPIADAPAWLIEAVTRRENESSASSSAGLRTRAKPSFRSRPHANVDADIDEIGAALMAVPNDASVTWDGWNRTGMAVFAATGGSAAGFWLFDRWSQKYPGYSAEDTAAKWAALESCPPTEIGLGTLFYEADRASPTWRSDYQVASLYAAAAELGEQLGSDDQVEHAMELFDAAEPLQGSLAERYLAGLGLAFPDGVREVLRFHPACHFDDSILPCLVALVQDSQTNQPVAVHLTALSAEATAVKRKTVGAVDCFSVIKLRGEVDDRGELTIAATIEAALVAMAAGFSAAWSVLSVQGIASFPRPRYHALQRLNVIVDGDEAAKAAGHCRLTWGSVVRIVVPKSAATTLFPFNMAGPAVLS